MPVNPPQTISQLYHLLDKHLALIEQALEAHKANHGELQKVLDDHENRLRAGFTLAGLTSVSGGLLSLLAVIKAFLS